MTRLDLYKNLFKGREDIFALRWEKGKKAGYRPEYKYDFFKYKAHKDAGGTFTDFKDKKPKPLNDKELGKHLRCTHFMGIYPVGHQSVRTPISLKLRETFLHSSGNNFLKV